MPRPGRFTPGKDPVHIVWEAGCARGPVWTVAVNLIPTGFRSPDRPARSQSLYWLSCLTLPVCHSITLPFDAAYFDWLGVQNVIFSSVMSVSVGQVCTNPCRKFAQETKLLTVAQNTVEPGYNDIGLYDTSPITSDILWYQLIPHC